MNGMNGQERQDKKVDRMTQRMDSNSLLLLICRADEEDGLCEMSIVVQSENHFSWCANRLVCLQTSHKYEGE